MKKTFLCLTSTLLFLTSCFSLAPQPQASAVPPASPTEFVPIEKDLSIFKNGLNPIYHNVIDELSTASLYKLDLIITDDIYRITGKESVRYTNNEDTALNEIHFRLFPNILGGEMTVENIRVNHESVKEKYKLKNSLLIVPLKNPLQINESVEIEMDFSMEISTTVDLNYGVQAYDGGVLALAHAYPMIAVYNDEGWNSEIPPQSGDVIFADMSFFIVNVQAPSDLVLVGSGVETKHEENGNRQTVRYEAGPVRDFYLAGSTNYQEFIRQVDGVTLRFYIEDYYEAGAEEALDFAEKSIEIFNSRYAPYPYTELDFVSTPTLALGIEYPGMIAITEWIMDPQIGYLEATIVHEVAHQWFYNLVGNDQLDEPWLDESMAQFATMQYFGDRYGQEGFLDFQNELKGRWAYIGNEEIPVGMPVRAYDDYEYSGIVYGRGALFFIALEEEMGSENFDAFMKDYAADNAFKISTTEVLRAEAEKACACDLGKLFTKWIYK